MPKKQSNGKGFSRDSRHQDKGGGAAGGTGRATPKKPHVNKQSAKQVMTRLYVFSCAPMVMHE